jgi:hypothetical protein
MVASFIGMPTSPAISLPISSVRAFLDLEQIASALGCGSGRPGFKRGACGSHGGVHVGLGAFGDTPHDFFGRGVNHVDGFAALGRGPLAIDIELVANLHDGFRGKSVKPSAHLPLSYLVD